MLTNQVINCSFSKWYSLFSHISIQSKIIKLSEEFIEYLLSDGIVLPKSSDVYRLEDNQNCDQLSDEWSDENDSNDDNIETDFEFPELEEEIKETLHMFGSVFPKLNWSSCEDSQWISPTGTSCRLSQDIYLLLKSSDRIVHDLTQPFKDCSDFNEENPPKVEYELVLKKWVDINPSMEFRCFISNNTLIGITQRDVRSYYNHIQQQKDDIITDIQHFFVAHLKNQFFDTNFVMDIYRPIKGRVILIDINPFGETTDSLLFDWEELNTYPTVNDSSKEFLPQFRYLTNESGIQTQRYSMNSLPIELNYGLNLDDLINGCLIDR